ncbi:TraR/DksA C4-type zinc finger protein [Megalodesulfovibrio paquesii]
MDEADQAQRAEAAFLAQALAQAGRAGAPELANADGLCPDCTDCGDPIPAARRQAMPGCRRCRDCQELYESERP